MDPVLRDRLLQSLLGKPLVSNAFRGTLVEAMLSLALEPDWRWCADGWGSYDFEHLIDGVGLEVKQSSALQNWHEIDCKPNSGRFDIRARTGRWEGAYWIAAPGRAAGLYLFAWHPEIDTSVADHRAADQWQFLPVLASALPDQKSIGLQGIRSLASPVSIDEVAEAVRELAAKIRADP
jgi:hypothetical protein